MELNYDPLVCQEPAVTGLHHHPALVTSEAEQRLRQLEMEQARLKSMHSATAVGVRVSALSNQEVSVMTFTSIPPSSYIRARYGISRDSCCTMRWREGVCWRQVLL